MSNTLHKLVHKQLEEFKQRGTDLKKAEEEIKTLKANPQQNLESIGQRIDELVQQNPILADRLNIIKKEISTIPSQPKEEPKKLTAIQKKALEKIEKEQENSLYDSAGLIDKLNEQIRRLKLDSAENTKNSTKNKEEIEFIQAYIELVTKNKETLTSIKNKLLEGSYTEASQLIESKIPQGNQVFDQKLAELYKYRKDSITSIQEAESKIIDNAWIQGTEGLISLVEQSQSDAKTKLAKERIASLKNDIESSLEKASTKKAIEGLFENYKKVKLIEVQQDFEQKIEPSISRGSFTYKILENIHSKASRFLSIMDQAKGKNSKEVIQIYQSQQNEEDVDPIYKEFLEAQIKYIESCPNKLQIKYETFKSSRGPALYKAKVTTIQKILANLNGTCIDLIDKIKEVEKNLKDPKNPKIQKYDAIHSLVLNSKEIGEEIKRRQNELSKLIKQVSKATLPRKDAQKEAKVTYAKLIASAYKATTTKLQVSVSKKAILTDTYNNYESLTKDMTDFEEVLSNIISQMDNETKSYYDAQFEKESIQKTLETDATKLHRKFEATSIQLEETLKTKLIEKIKVIEELSLQGNFEEAYELLQPYYVSRSLEEKNKNLQDDIDLLFEKICTFLGKTLPAKKRNNTGEPAKKTASRLDPKPSFDPNNFMSMEGFTIMPSNVEQIYKAVLSYGEQINKLKDPTSTETDKDKKIAEIEGRLKNLKELIKKALDEYPQTFNVSVTFNKQTITAKQAYSGEVLVAIAAYLPTNTTKIQKVDLSKTGAIRFTPDGAKFREGIIDRDDQEAETSPQKEIAQDQEKPSKETQNKSKTDGKPKSEEDQKFGESLFKNSTGGKKPDEIQKEGNNAVLENIRSRKKSTQIRTDYKTNTGYGYDMDALGTDIENALLPYQDKIREYSETGEYSGDISDINWHEVKRFQILIQECQYLLENHEKHRSFGFKGLINTFKRNTLLTSIETYKASLTAIKNIFEEYLQENNIEDTTESNHPQSSDPTSRNKFFANYQSAIRKNSTTPQKKDDDRVGFSVADLFKAQKGE